MPRFTLRQEIDKTWTVLGTFPVHHAGQPEPSVETEDEAFDLWAQTEKDDDGVPFADFRQLRLVRELSLGAFKAEKVDPPKPRTARTIAGTINTPGKE